MATKTDLGTIARGSKPVPRPEGLDAEFYRHCAAGRLCFQRCRGCQVYRHVPRRRCGPCGSPDWEWSASGGVGRVFSWTVTHQALHPAFASEVPYAVAVVELEEGVRMAAGLRDIDPGAIELDLPVEVRFEPVGEDLALPYFRPRASGD